MGDNRVSTQHTIKSLKSLHRAILPYSKVFLIVLALLKSHSYVDLSSLASKNVN